MIDARAALLALLLVCAAGPAAARDAALPPNALTLFGARMTDNTFDEVLTGRNIGWIDATLVGIAGSHRLYDIGGARLEAEAQVVRHFGDQTHWEFNALVTGRWHRFPWSDTLHTSVAWGIGPSYATQKPAAELARSGTTERLLVYWMAELEVGPADQDWSVLARLHHRSTGFDLLGDGGGSNWVTAGLRWRF
ncbi:hypothetical protein [Azospirillum halopraeferens]|uniref:hypothetical protein n=1 Tax=Azospirillum halopraeferens TaxID=34010 RepID=UPI000418D3DD|nr:hypothetical protein [Azospirillum halopraeferens]